MALDLASAGATRLAATDGAQAGGLAAQSVNILCKVCLPPSRLHTPVSLGVSGVSSRSVTTSVG
jgi:hypothetical protein